MRKSEAAEGTRLSRSSDWHLTLALKEEASRIDKLRHDAAAHKQALAQRGAACWLAGAAELGCSSSPWASSSP